jgi:hypothetical protein
MRLIKGASHHNGEIWGPGYALLGAESAREGQVIYHLPLLDRNAVHFVFGFKGVGSHFLVKVCWRQGLIAVYHIQDGIPVYLNHVLVRLPENAVLEILHDADFLSISSSGYSLINVLHDGNAEGEWGFGLAGRSRLSSPSIQIDHRPKQDLEWVVLGDGFSNNRWPNRHFVSWPELLFGTSVSYLNACVAAANSTRVLAVAEGIASRMRHAAVIIAMGTDDLIEGQGLEFYLRNVDRLLTVLESAGARDVWIANLPPVRSLEAHVSEWNNALSQRILGSHIRLIDIHSLLMADPSSYMAQGNYPNSDGQWVIAEHLAFVLKNIVPRRPDMMSPREGMLGKVFLRLSGLIARAASNTISLNP